MAITQVIPYGRSAEAIARQCREEGVDVTEHDCARMIEFYFEQYPGTEVFLKECRERSQIEGWVASCYGRKRRFIKSRDRGVVGEQQRQAQNFSIQATVADALWSAIANFHQFKQDNPGYRFSLLLPIHDALLFGVPFENLRSFVFGTKDVAGNPVTSVLQEMMVNQVPIWPRSLDNRFMPVAEPYFFGIDFDIYVNWGESITQETAAREGIPEDLWELIL